MRKRYDAPLRTLAAALLAATALIGAAATPAAAAAGTSKVLATVNGSDITEDDVRIATADLGPALPQQLQGPQREAYVLDYLIDLKLAAGQAAQEKLGDNPEFAKKMAYYHDKVLMEDLLGNIAKTAVTPEAEKKVYDDAAKAQPPETEIHARHILVPTEAEAKAALERVKKGEDFAKVADEVSKDPGSQGGDLGWFTKDKMVPEFAAAAFKLEPGQVSDPVKSEFGWHVIKVEGKREKAFPPFDQVKDQVARYVAQKAQSDDISKLREQAKIVRNTPAPAAAPTPAAPAGAAPAADAPKP
ncbi:peptidylprolyl isomerase [Lichenibacterium dinghuense]|uniref:peptidylprolyl isomerase n=1 Tax=Lichenibacterium dinghuense TaxID=2895977 RepID=UPI001F1A659B|nr:peptidylprolyl isomerase [Lichenibacterium sp. 6Y81]